MKIAIEGCCHGELDKIYESLGELEKLNDLKVDLLIICGDFQAVRSFDDLQAMAVPPKFQHLNTFYKYYNGEKVAPVLTVFIGGNHEASNYMQELPYGGWVAPKIYYMGYAGIIQIGGLRIGGISGIYKGHDFNRGHHEKPPYERDTIRSVYHIRNLEVFRLKQISRHVDIFISHDWPKGIYYHGDTASLIKRKPFFQQEIEENKLGSRPLSELLTHLQPSYWFAAHLHVKFAAHVEHKPTSDSHPAKCTKFLALDKCLPRRSFLQVIDVHHNKKEGLKIQLDPEWLTVLKNTNHLLNLTSSNSYMPGPGCEERYDFTVTDKDMETMRKTFGDDLTLPENFVQTSPPIGGGNLNVTSRQPRRPLTVQVNPQTTLLCTMLDITDPNAKFLGTTSKELMDESYIGLSEDGSDNIGNDSGHDTVDDDDGEIPSSIDSSIDVFTEARNNSSWGTFHTAKESPNSLVGLSPNVSFVGTSTPLRGFHTPLRTADVKVDDDDDEFLSILSAQKSKSKSPTKLLSHLESSSAVSSVEPSLTLESLNDKKSIPPLCGTTGSGHARSVSPSKNLKHISNSSQESNCFSGDFGNQEQGDDELHAILLEQKSRSRDGGDDSKTVSSTGVPSLPSFSSSDISLPSLKSQRASFGMSDLNLDSQISSSSLPSSSPSSTSIYSPDGFRNKRPSPEHLCQADSSTSSTQGSSISRSSGSGVKKLKRRNVSVYSEPLE